VREKNEVDASLIIWQYEHRFMSKTTLTWKYLKKKKKKKADHSVQW
jgi:hypothetical protein